MKATRAWSLLMLALSTQALAQQPLPVDEGVLTSGSGVCAACHTGAVGVMMEDGRDISPATMWRSTMMGQSARDPLWQAKVRSECLHSPDYAELIQSKCTRCHAPQGSVEAFHSGATAYSLDEALADPLARDGVSCTLCHQIDSANLGQDDSFTGGFHIGTQRRIYGPYANPLTGPMQVNSGFTPVLGAHVGQSELCATCHTLFTPWLDNEGQVGGTFPEQVPYMEWLNSLYPAQGLSCQGCHMPQSATAQDISTMPPWHVQSRQPFFKHEFVGGNAWMSGVLRDNASSLGLTASPAQFADTRARATDMLSRAAWVDVWGTEDGDTLDISVRVTNRSGHKLPTGIPLRRMWLHMVVISTTGDTLFESGAWDAQGNPPVAASGWEPHHQVILDPSHTQIWEGVMGDADEAPTWVLLRASHFLKDNRLPPAGFRSDAGNYDVVRVVGVPSLDTDFNRVEGVEGSGADLVHYRFPTPAESLMVTAELVYQSVPSGLQASFASQDAPEIATWRQVAAGANFQPLRMAMGQWLFNGSLPAPQVDLRVEAGQVLLNWAQVADALGYRVWQLDVPWSFPGSPQERLLVGECAEPGYVLPQSTARAFFQVTAWR